MNLIRLIVILIFALFAASASAQFYKYVDEEGNIRFTDDINQVPPEQRANIQKYVESFSDSEEDTLPKEETQNAQEQEISVDLSDDSEQESLGEARKRLVALKEEIDNEYKELVKEKEKLAKEKAKAVNRKQILEYNEKVDKLNERVKAYQQKGKDYEAQVEAYNARVTEENAARKAAMKEDNNQ
mgnify:CR=1 FL=1